MRYGLLLLGFVAVQVAACAPSAELPTAQFIAPTANAKSASNWSPADVSRNDAAREPLQSYQSGHAVVQKASLVTTQPAASSASPTKPLALKAPLTGVGHSLTGIASYYWQDQMTANGERFDKRAMTAAHKTLPLGTRVRVTHVASGRSVVVRINDRGPYKPGRIIDLSEAAAEQLQMTAAGLAAVTVEVVK
jgi:rare lipoprotein A